MATIVVAGSLNMDFVVAVEHLPAPGETILGSGFQTLPGGKGANQACAAGRLASLDVRTRMIGRVGYDLFGDQLKASLAAAGVDVSSVRATKSQPTGVALIWVDRRGQNSIVVAPGANNELNRTHAESWRTLYRGASYALFQLETPLDAVEAGLHIARDEKVCTILDPAPARDLPAGVLEAVDILTPNESEACLLLGRSATAITFDGARQIAGDLLALGPRSIILKLGERGCFYKSATEEIGAPGFEMDARDATAAGDTFNGALAVALAEGRPIAAALRFANAAAAISVTRVGAQASVPSRDEVDAFLATR